MKNILLLWEGYCSFLERGFCCYLEEKKFVVKRRLDGCVEKDEEEEEDMVEKCEKKESI